MRAHSLPSLSPCRTPGSDALSKSKGVSLVHWDANRGVLALACKRSLQLFRFDDSISDFTPCVADLPVPERVRALAWAGQALCLGFEGEYVIQQLSSGTLSEVFPTGRARTPCAAPLPGSQLLLLRDASSVAVCADGSASHRGMVVWRSPPLSVAVSFPFAVALLPQGHIEARPLPRGGTPAGAATQRLRCSPGAFALCSPSSPSSAHATAPSSAAASLSPPPLLVLARDAITLLRPLPLAAQIAQLASRGEYAAALELAECLPGGADAEEEEEAAEDDEEEGEGGAGAAEEEADARARAAAGAAALRSSLHGRAAAALFAQRRFAEAFGHWEQSPDTPPGPVLARLPGLGGSSGWVARAGEAAAAVGGGGDGGGGGASRVHCSDDSDCSGSSPFGPLEGAAAAEALSAALPWLAGVRSALWARRATQLTQQQQQQQQRQQDHSQGARATQPHPPAEDNGRGGGGDGWEEEARVVDTALLRLLVSTRRPSSELMRLLSSPHRVRLAEGLACVGPARHAEAAALLRAHGRHSDALARLARLPVDDTPPSLDDCAGRGWSVGACPPGRHAAVASYLLSTPPSDPQLFADFLPPLLEAHPQLALGVLCAADPPLPPGPVLALLREHAPHLRAPYLAAELAARGGTTPREFHTALVLLRMEAVAAEHAAATANHSGGDDAHAPHAPLLWDEGAVSAARAALLACLDDPACRYAPERLLSRLPLGRQRRERASLLRRLGRHSDAIDLFLDAGDGAAAEGYADSVWGSGGNDTTSAALHGVAQPESQHEADCADVYLLLLRSLLVRGGGAPVGGLAPLALLSRCATRVDAAAALSSLPPSTRLAQAGGFVEGALRAAADASRHAALQRALRRAEAIDAAAQAAAARARSVTVGPQRRCGACGARLGGGAVAAQPDGAVVHYACAMAATAAGAAAHGGG